MKKLTAGIFATILGLTTVNAFAATAGTKVASTTYVDQAVEAVQGFVTDKGYATEEYADAQAAAAQTAATNAATTKADKALTDAKAYADTELAKKQNLLTGTNFKKDGEGNVISGFTVADGVVTFSTASVATSEGLEQLTTTVNGHTSSINNINTALAGKQAALTDAQLNAVDSGITAELVSTYNGYAATIAGAVSDASTAKTNAATAVADAAQAIKDAGSAVDAAAAAAGVADAASKQADSALGKANSAVETANAAKTAADTATTNVTNLTTTVSGHTTTIGEHTTAISNLQAADTTFATQQAEQNAEIAKKANSADVYDKTTANSTFVLAADVVDSYPYVAPAQAN